MQYIMGWPIPGFFLPLLPPCLFWAVLWVGKLLNIYSRERIIMPCLITYIISMVILAFSKTQPMFILACNDLGDGTCFSLPLVSYSTLLIVQVLLQGRLSDWESSLQSTCILERALGPADLMGIVIDMASYPIRHVSSVLAFTGIVNFNYFYFFMKKKDDPLIITIASVLNPDQYLTPADRKPPPVF